MDVGTFWELIKLVLPAGGAFLGVYYAQRQLAKKDARQASADAERAAKEAVYVASLVVKELELYIDGCLAVAQDNGTVDGRPAGGDGWYQTTTKTPTFDPHALNVDLRTMPSALIYEVLTITSHQAGIENFLSSPGFDDPPFDDYIAERAFQYAKLGQQVTAIAKRLRSATGIPNDVLTKGDWSRDEALAGVAEQYEQRRAERARLHRESGASFASLPDAGSD